MKCIVEGLSDIEHSRFFRRAQQRLQMLLESLVERNIDISETGDSGAILEDDLGDEARKLVKIIIIGEDSEDLGHVVNADDDGLVSEHDVAKVVAEVPVHKVVEVESVCCEVGVLLIPEVSLDGFLSAVRSLHQHLNLLVEVLDSW